VGAERRQPDFCSDYEPFRMFLLCVCVSIMSGAMWVMMTFFNLSYIRAVCSEGLVSVVKMSETNVVLY
jgi:E3 ubiquitin-protein ligase DOA10